jgi:hypothetical protein
MFIVLGSTEKNYCQNKAEILKFMWIVEKSYSVKKLRRGIKMKKRFRPFCVKWVIGLSCSRNLNNAAVMAGNWFNCGWGRAPPIIGSRGTVGGRAFSVARCECSPKFTSRKIIVKKGENQMIFSFGCHSVIIYSNWLFPHTQINFRISALIWQ